MRRRGLVLGLVLVLVTNALVLFGIARNRASAESTLALTEREAALRTHGEENTGLSLTLRWQSAHGWEERSWFDRETLAACGFDVDVPVDDVTDGDAPAQYRDRLHRPAWVVYELGGDAWERWRVRRDEEHAEKIADMRRDGRPEESVLEAETYHARRMAAESQLFAIDAGADRDALRKRYPDGARHAIVPSEVSIGLRTRRDPDTNKIVERWLQGTVHGPLVSELHVPPAFRPVLLPLADARDRFARALEPGAPAANDPTDGSPRYAVTVSWGARGEPWLEAVTELESTQDAGAEHAREAPPAPSRPREGDAPPPKETTP